MTVGELKKILEKYPDYDVCLFDDNADEYGDSDGNIKINLDEDAVDNYPLEDGEDFIYLVINEEITAI
jgi:hypothetical protein